MAAAASTQELLGQFKALCEELPKRFGRQIGPERFMVTETAGKLIKRLQTPQEFASNQTWAAAELSGAAVGIELGIFKALCSTSSPLTISEIAAKCKGGDEVLINRIVSLLAAHGMVEQVDETHFGANPLTQTYTTDARVGNVFHQLAMLPAFAALPYTLRENGYKNLVDPAHCAFQTAYKTEHTAWDWSASSPEMSKFFNDFITGIRGATWGRLATIYPFEEVLKGSTPEEVVFVDVGGGLGQQAVNFRKSFPKGHGRVILQDLSHVVPKQPLEDIEIMSHDMMTEQPVHGARIYYFRGVVHDHSDPVCQKFLSQIVKAMDRNSRLLVHDQIVDKFLPPHFTTRTDLGMMAMYAGQERSAPQMHALLESVGLKVTSVHKPGPRQLVITEAMLP